MPLKIVNMGVPNVALQIKDPALPQLWSRLQLWLGFATLPWNFHMLWMQPNEKKKKSEHTENIFTIHVFNYAEFSRIYKEFL